MPGVDDSITQPQPVAQEPARETAPEFEEAEGEWIQCNARVTHHALHKFNQTLLCVTLKALLQSTSLLTSHVHTNPPASTGTSGDLLSARTWNSVGAWHQALFHCC